MESRGGTTDAVTAAAQLAALQADRDRLADRAMQPWWHDVGLGVVVFGLISASAVDNPVIMIAVIVICAAGLGALVSAYKRVTGMWVNVFRRGPTRKAVNTWMLVYALVIVPAFVLHLGYELDWPVVVA